MSSEENENNLDYYLSLLNEEQNEAVRHEGSPLLILAGAGSGKTRVITTKIAYLIAKKNINPFSILAVTFTKKAAKEMQERAVAMEERAANAQIRTFHSFGAWFLRQFASEAGIDKNFTVYDDDDMITIVNKAVPGLTKQQASLAAKRISLAKDYCITPDSKDIIEISNDKDFPIIYEAYQTRLRSTGNVDFGDLIMLPVQVLEQNPNVQKQINYRFNVIMVDEYQDSNMAQFRLLQALAGFNDTPADTNHVSISDITSSALDESEGPEKFSILRQTDSSDTASNTKHSQGTDFEQVRTTALKMPYICVVGDDDQSIYKFRGAEVQNILSFQKQFPNTKLIRLEKNYRSTARILQVADKVVSKNESRLGKTLVAARGDGKQPVLTFLDTQDDEAEFCASLIKKAHLKGVPYQDWAILYRTNAQSLGFETEFLHQKIPYTIVGSLKFYDREEIKDILAFLALIANPRDEIAFRRIVNKPARGIGGVAQDKIVALALQDGVMGSLIKSAEKYSETASKKAKEGLTFFTSQMNDYLQSLESATGEDNLSVFVEKIMNSSGLLEYHKTQDEIADTQKVLNLQELSNSAVLYKFTQEGLLDFLDHIELDRTLEKADGQEEADSVTLITLHNTKGLEFPRVIITGLEYGIFPRQEKQNAELEEERRLFYVGITRAKDELYITSCAQRRLYGHIQFMEPSPFLAEAGKDSWRLLGKVPRAFAYATSKDGDGTEENSSQPTNPLFAKWSVGTRIYHDEFGYGQIVRTETKDSEFVISVSFENSGIKKFLPEYQSGSLLIVKD
jgi:DNA helicase-2/ATP-dependent DNA helicase PcrA